MLDRPTHTCIGRKPSYNTARSRQAGTNTVILQTTSPTSDKLTMNEENAFLRSVKIIAVQRKNTTTDFVTTFYLNVIVDSNENSLRYSC